MKKFILSMVILAAGLFQTIAASQLSQEEYYYFSYGRNMSSQVMEELFPNSKVEFIGVYQIDGYEFAYDRIPYRPGKTNTGSNIHFKENSIVYGTVWKMSKTDLEILDDAEATPIVYQRYNIVATNPKDPKDQIQVEIYMANPDYISSTCYPHPDIVRTVVKGALDHGLPLDYIKKYLIWTE